MSHLRNPVSANDHQQGAAHPVVQIVEYGDYQCPYCGDAYPTVKALTQRHGDRVSVVFRNFPLVEAHPEARNAAVVAEFAATHGQFWAAHDALYDNQNALGPELYAGIARALGLDVAELQRAFDQGTYDARIQQDLEGGIRSGVNGTPCFFINGERYDVTGGFNTLADVVESLLARA